MDLLQIEKSSVAAYNITNQCYKPTRADSATSLVTSWKDSYSDPFTE